MKKIISLVLCMVMLLALIPAISVSADDYTYKLLEENKVSYVTLWENRGYEYYSCLPRESGLYNLYSVGTEDTFVYIYDEFGNELSFDDDSGVENNFNLFIELERSKAYFIVVSAYYDTYSRFDMYLEKVNEDESYPLELDEEVEIILSAGDRKDFFKFTPDEDGYYAFYSTGDEEEYYWNPYALLHDESFNVLDKDNDSGLDNNFSLACYLTKGNTYYFEATRLKGSVDMVYSVSIKKTDVIVKTEVISKPENMRYYDGFVEEMIDYSGLELEFTYSNGEKINWKYDEQTEIDGTTVDVMLLKDDDGKYFIYVIAGFSDCSIYLEVVDSVDSEIKSISVYSMPDIVLYENISGYKKYEGSINHWNFIYKYEIPQETMMEIKYTDGTSKIVNYYDTVDGENFTAFDEQLTKDGSYVKNLWSLGENPITIEYYGLQTTVNARVVENPVESFTVHSAPTKKYRFWLNDTYYNTSYCKYYPSDLSGLSFTVHYKDGTQQTYTDADIDMNKQTIGGYRYDINDQMAFKPGLNTATIEFMDRELSFEVILFGRGDVDKDGKVTIMDAALIQMNVAKQWTFDWEETQVADTDGDGIISVLDATKIQRYLAKIIDYSGFYYLN